jgi:predicted CXXCH cytochrome family protein
VCHSPKSGFGLGPGNSTGNHPQGGNPAEISRAELPLQVLPPFKTPFPTGYPLLGGRESDTAHWDLGGHLSQGAEGTIACVTCHAVHGDEGQPPAASLLAVDPVNDVADLFCEGCHAGQRGDALSNPALPNPGGTTAGRTYHPCDDDAANGEGRIVEVGVPAAWPLGGGEPRRLLCSTCHGAHGAQPATALQRPPSEGATFCGSCHLGMPLAYHHSVASGGKCDQFLAAPKEGEPPGLSCASCHRAHNAGLGTRDERRFVPLLREEWAQPACLRCHPEGNPTCDGTPAATASHFLGDPLEAFGDAKPPLWREAWPESGLFSGYGGAGGLLYGKPDATAALGALASEVTCLSCHAFRRGALVSGDPLGTTASGSARGAVVSGGARGAVVSGGTLGTTVSGGALGLVVPASTLGATVSGGALGAPHLLARSGASVEWAVGEENRYLCTGCHSVSPGTAGQSHPMMIADVGKLSQAVLPPATITPKGHLNCDSCHRPHRAVTASGYYILEAVGGAGTEPLTVHPKIDYTSLCRLCHEKY